MASIYHLLDDAIHTEDDIIIKYKDLEHVSKEVFFAAVRIQKAYRGYVVRKTIKKWNTAATRIQKIVRGWLVRYHLPDIIHEYYDQRCFENYNKMTTIIQSVWRGYMVRKKVCIQDVLVRKEQILAASEMIKASIKQNTEVSYDTLDPTMVKKVMKILFDRHHLLKTQQREGIFSNSDCRELSELEKILQSMKWREYMDKLRQYYNRYSKNEGAYEYMFEDKKLKKLEDIYRQRDKSRDAKVDYSYIPDPDVQQEPLKTKMDPKPYERCLSTIGKYTPPNLKIIRTEDKSRNICDKDFDLNLLKKFAKETDVPPYYINFWYEQCKMHNLPD